MEFCRQQGPSVETTESSIVVNAMLLEESISKEELDKYGVWNQNKFMLKLIIYYLSNYYDW
ncbi:hypothetical protein A8M56_20785 [Yersinia pestis]|nr:hypothetical protein A8M56_20785 [Yersinia pestis]